MKKWIINAATPFRGIANSYMLEDGTVAFTQGMTFVMYNAIHGYNMKIVDDDEFNRMVDEYKKNNA